MVTIRSLGLLLALLTLPLAYGHDDGQPNGGTSGAQPPKGETLPTPTLVCPGYAGDAYPEMAPLAMVKASSLGAIDGAASVSSAGSARYSIPLTVPPGRRAPDLGVVYDSRAPSGTIGKGFAISGLSSIHRCGANLAQDDDVRGLQLTPADHVCLDGARLVPIHTGSDSTGAFTEYRTWPDSHTKVLGYGAPAANGFDVTHFVAYLSNGTIVHYGKSPNARTGWRGGVTRAWNKELDVDRRGNTIRYKYAALSSGAKDSTTQEQVIDTITYTGFIDENGVETLGDAVIDFEYNDDKRHGKLFYEGEQLSRRMRLARIDMRKNGSTVRSYRFEYGEDSATNEALLTRLDECAAGDVTQAVVWSRCHGRRSSCA